MNSTKLLSRWTVLPAAAVFFGVTTPSSAFTDANAELKEATQDRSARVVVVAKAAPPVQTVWVPVSAKRLDGFKPAFPPESRVARREPAQTVAKADPK